jgi:dehydrogenase/reductase SDR family member 7B
MQDIIDDCKSIQPNTRFIPWQLDLSNYQSIDENYNILKTLLTGSNIDVLINNAGVSSRGGALDCTMDSLQKVFSTNFFGTVSLTKLVVNDLINVGKGGFISVITSVQGKIGLPYRTSYSSSKHALQGYFDGLRGEVLPYNIYTTVISPGYVKTQLSMNAVNNDGSNYGKTDANTAKGMDPKELAVQVLVAIANKQIDVVVADPLSKAAVYVKNIIPELLARMVQNRK